MKTILQQGILPEDRPEKLWIGECHFCNAIYSGTNEDIIKQTDNGKDYLDRDCNFCGKANSVSYYINHTTRANEILAKVRA